MATTPPASTEQQHVATIILSNLSRPSVEQEQQVATMLTIAKTECPIFLVPMTLHEAKSSAVQSA
jgi:hypothetical protein